VRTTLLNGTVVALSAVALALVGGTLGLVELWPVLLAAGVGLLLGVPRLPHVLALLGGGAVALFGAWLDLILLPETAAARAGSVALAVVLLTGLSAATRGRLPLAPGLIGWATLTGLLLPQLATDPTGFARIAPVTAAGALLGVSLGLLAAQVAVLLGGAAGRDGVIGRTMSRRRSGGPAALSVVVAAGMFATTAGPAAAAAPVSALRSKIVTFAPLAASILAVSLPRPEAPQRMQVERRVRSESRASDWMVRQRHCSSRSAAKPGSPLVIWWGLSPVNLNSRGAILARSPCMIATLWLRFQRPEPMRWSVLCGRVRSGASGSRSAWIARSVATASERIIHD
jgi:hypothetical protein